MRDIARRSLLTEISAVPAAVIGASLPTAVLAQPVASAAHADADLIAMAAQVTRLSRLSDKAHDRAGRKSDAVMQARGPRPVEPDTSGLTEIAEHDVDPASDIERRFTMTFRKPTAARQETRRRFAEALAAWQATSDRLARETGTSGAAALCDTLFDRLQKATDALAAMTATSPAGLAAKAGAYLALMQTRHGTEEWEVDLGHSLARDAARMGAGAA